MHFVFAFGMFPLRSFWPFSLVKYICDRFIAHWNIYLPIILPFDNFLMTLSRTRYRSDAVVGGWYGHEGGRDHQTEAGWWRGQCTRGTGKNIGGYCAAHFSIENNILLFSKYKLRRVQKKYNANHLDRSSLSAQMVKN